MQRLLVRESVDHFAKTQLLATRVGHSGPPIWIALDWLTNATQRNALIALLCGDFLLGRYCGNFFAKGLVPQQPRHVNTARAAGIDPSRVCLTCWHLDRSAALDDEAHVLLQCPLHAAARSELSLALSPRIWAQVVNAAGAPAGVTAMMSSSSACDWQAFAAFLVKVRQARRHAKRNFESMQAALDKRGFFTRRVAWRSAGKFVCRHGVFFSSPPARHCPCMGPADVDPAVWAKARYMPVLDQRVKTILVTPFDVALFCRLGELQAALRRLP